VNHPHLTDDQLQDFLDSNIPGSDPIVAHLDGCPRCRQALAAYKGLYSAMEKEAAMELPCDFADAVMERLPQEQAAHQLSVPSRLHIKDSMAVFVAVAAAIAAAVYFLGPDVLLKPFTALFGSSQLPENQFLTDVSGYLSQLNFSTLTVIFAILTFAGIGAVDRIIAHRREHRKPISYLI
jgi:hypothetical protein